MGSVILNPSSPGSIPENLDIEAAAQEIAQLFYTRDEDSCTEDVQSHAEQAWHKLEVLGRWEDQSPGAGKAIAEQVIAKVSSDLPDWTHNGYGAHGAATPMDTWGREMNGKVAFNRYRECDTKPMSDWDSWHQAELMTKLLKGDTLANEVYGRWFDNPNAQKELSRAVDFYAATQAPDATEKRDSFHTALLSFQVSDPLSIADHLQALSTPALVKVFEDQATRGQFGPEEYRVLAGRATLDQLEGLANKISGDQPSALMTEALAEARNFDSPEARGAIANAFLFLGLSVDGPYRHSPALMESIVSALPPQDFIEAFSKLPKPQQSSAAYHLELKSLQKQGWNEQDVTALVSSPGYLAVAPSALHQLVEVSPLLAKNLQPDAIQSLAISFNQGDNSWRDTMATAIKKDGVSPGNVQAFAQGWMQSIPQEQSARNRQLQEVAQWMGETTLGGEDRKKLFERVATQITDARDAALLSNGLKNLDDRDAMVMAIHGQKQINQTDYDGIRYALAAQDLFGAPKIGTQ